MRLHLPVRSVLTVVLVASSALASGERAELFSRTLLFSEHPDDATHRVYVKGKVVTTLRFEANVDPDKTKMLGWEGRLEPLAVVRKEETSEDHALAALLAAGAVSQTPFMIAEHFSGRDADAEVDATVFQGKGKAAVVFKIKNVHAENSWSVQRVRLVTKGSGYERAVAVRATVREITPGGSGVMAIVADGSAFVDDGVLTSLWLEVYRHDGLRQAFVQLDPALIAR